MVVVVDALHDKGSTFWVFCFLNDGAPYPKIAGISYFLSQYCFFETLGDGFFLRVSLSVYSKISF